MKITKIIVILKTTSGHYGFRFIRTIDGKMVEGRISGGESNIRGALGMTNGKWVSNYHVFTIRINQKELNTLPYAGCRLTEIKDWVTKELRKKSLPKS